MNNNNNFVINSRKFDGSIYKTWSAELIRQVNSLFVFKGIFENEINHPVLKTIPIGTISYEYYWLDKWFNIFQFHQPNGNFRFFYCNVNMPPQLTNNFLDYVDLDIDVLVQKDFSYTILDLDEFDKNSVIYQYPQEIISKTKRTLTSIEKLIAGKGFPFSEICKFDLTD